MIYPDFCIGREIRGIDRICYLCNGVLSRCAFTDDAVTWTVVTCFGKCRAGLVSTEVGVILVGEKQTKPIFDGLKEMNYEDEKIHVINDVKEAYLLLNKLKQ